MHPKSKVRTGCSVCKTRRVKCDETKPFCTRCTSTGRTCEGYMTPPPRKSRPRRSKYDVLQTSLDRGIGASLNIPDVNVVGSIVDNMAQVWRLPRSVNHAGDGVDWGGSRSLAYYRTRVSKAISNYFDENFWNTLVLQVSEEEPSVRHALVALSALYEASETSRLLDLASSKDRYRYLMRSAICQHNKAISTLLNKTSAGGPILEVVIMSCLIFVWLEFLRDNVNDAMAHLHSGFRIICEQRQLRGSQVAVKHMAQILGRALIQATLHRSSTVDFDYYAAMGYSSSSRPLEFLTLREARCDLDGKISGTLRFVRRVEGAGVATLHHECYASPHLPCLKCMYQVHIHGFNQWKAAFESLRDRLDFNALTANEIYGMHQLELSYLLISNTLKIVFATTPMVFDSYNDDYARMLYLIRHILHSQTLRRATSLFTFPVDNSVQGGLLNIIFRCRHLPIRREAFQFLQLCPDNEGIWQRTSLVALCKWKIDIEEKGRPQDALETDPLPESARVYAEKAREVVRDGQSVVAICFKRGVSSSRSDFELDEVEVPNVSMRLARLLGMQGALSLRPSGDLGVQRPTTKPCAVAL